MKRVLGLGLFILLLGLILPTPLVFAEDFDYKVTSTFNVDDENQAFVENVVEVKNNTDKATPSEIQFPAVGDNITDVTARYKGDGKITAEYENSSITLNLSKDNKGKDKTWTFIVEYNSDISEEFGDTTALIVPAMDFEDLPVTHQVVELATSSERGTGIIRGSTPSKSLIRNLQQVLVWQNTEGVLDEAVGQIFGDVSVSRFELSTTLINDSFWWQTQTVTLPPDNNQQKVFLESVEPQPTSIHLDVDGNILADFKLRPKQKINVNAVGFIDVSNYNYSLNEELKQSDIPVNLVDQYTANTETWPSGRINAEIPENASVYSIIKAIYDAAIEDTNIGSGASGFERTKIISDSLIGELRNQKIPARSVIGKAYFDGNDLFSAPQPHAWVEAYIPGTGWITLDPVVGQNMDIFGTTDISRVGLVIRGISDSQPPQNLDQISIGWVKADEAEKTYAEPTVTATNYMILPGIAIQSVDVSMAPGNIVDGAAVAIGDEPAVPLGSLAPLQKTSIRSIEMLGSAFSSIVVNYGIASEGQIITTEAQTNTSISYIPMIILIGIILLIVVARIIWKKKFASSARKDKVKKTKDNLVLAVEDDGKDSEKLNIIPEEPQDPVPEPVQEEKPHHPTPVATASTGQKISDLPHRKPQDMRPAHPKPAPRTRPFTPSQSKGQIPPKPRSSSPRSRSGAIMPSSNVEASKQRVREQIQKRAGKGRNGRLIQ